MIIYYASCLFSIIFFLNGILVGQQVTFEYITGAPNNMYFSDIVESSDGDIFYCGGFSSSESQNKTKSYLIKLDKYGQFLDSLNTTDSNKSSFCNNIFTYDNGDLLLVESLFDSLNVRTNAKFILNKLDNGLNILKQSVYYFPPNYKLVHMSATSDLKGEIMVGGAVKIESDVWRPFVYVVNDQFDSVISRFYTNEIGTVLQMNTLLGGDYWLIRAISDVYCRTDSLLNIISEQAIPNYLHGNIGVKWDSDTSFFLVGDQLYPTPSHNLGLLRQYYPIDTSGHLFNNWGISDTIDLPAVTNGIDFKNRDTIFIGGTRNVYLGSHNPWPSWFIILQTDSMLNVRWEKFYGGDAYYVMGKIIATHDGGCLIGGTRYDYQNVSEEQTDIIILKLNENGILVGSEDHPSIKTQEVIVYPNPGTNEIKIRIAAQHPETLFQLFDMNGKLVISTNIVGKWGTINTTNLNLGTYIFRITSKQGLFESGKWVKQR